MTPTHPLRLAVAFFGVVLLALGFVIHWEWRASTVQSTVPAAATPYLPFELPIGPSSHKVFAHYVPWLPISLDNLPSDHDYYTTQYLTPTGEDGEHAAYGGLLRDRPLPRPPVENPDWQQIDLETEIAQAKSVGIDGFAIDITQPESASAAPRHMLIAAQSANEFSILVTADMSGTFADISPEAFGAEFSKYLVSPSAFRLQDGRVVLGAFQAEQKTVEWWQSALKILRDSYHIPIAFVPTFVNPSPAIDRFADISYGLSAWGDRDPDSLSPKNTEPDSSVDLLRRAHAKGKIWMQPIAFQDNRPREGIYSETLNGLTSRNAWQLATQQGADWVQLITWNDYAEMTAIAPSVKHGWKLLDLNAYGIATFKAGKPPTVLRDAVYLIHRLQPYAAQPSYPETVLMAPNPDDPVPPRDAVEVDAFSRQPSIVRVQIGAANYSCDVPAGLGVCTFPLSPGNVSAAIWRDNHPQSTAHSSMPITDTPYVQDLQYVVAGGLR